MEINKFLFSSSIRKQAFKRYSYKSKALEKYTNKLKGYNIGIGDWIQAPNTCISGNRGPNKELMSLLKKKNPDVHYIDEFKTSANCSVCFHLLTKYDPVKKQATASMAYSKLRKCQNCNIIIHRDQNGSRNIAMLHTNEINGFDRPIEFCRNSKFFI